MIRGKYLREKKAIRFKRRVKLMIIMLIIVLLYRIIFSSFSLYESEASSSSDIDVAFFTIEDSYDKNVISLDDMKPGETKEYYFSIANFKVEEDGTKKMAETDMEYNLSVRTTTNLYFEYELYVDQNPSDTSAENISIINPTPYRDDYRPDATYFKTIANHTEKFLLSQGENTDNYILKIKLPSTYDSVEYQNIIDCIEITVDAKQILPFE